MRKLLSLSLIVIYTFTISCLHAEANQFHDRDKEKDYYTWRPTDESQYHQAVGMVIWGVTIAVASLLIAALVPSTPSANPSTGSAQSSGNLF